jgi:diguanylate cyclase (GGDEF)-like protein/PAS domain S-box-containing protein
VGKDMHAPATSTNPESTIEPAAPVEPHAAMDLERTLEPGAPDGPAGASVAAAVELGEAGITRLFEMTSDLLATISLDGAFKLVNPAWERVLGWTREELQTHNLSELIHPDDVEQTMALVLAGEGDPAGDSDSDRPDAFTNRFRHRDGSWHALLWSARCDGELWYMSAKDVTDPSGEEHEALNDLEHQALHDPLTHLPNRSLLMDRTRQAVARLHRSPGVVALLFIDLDRFKAVNDNLGHEVGDMLLISVSKRLEELMRDSDTVARLGGDEFVILAEEIVSDGEALALAERVLHAMEDPFQLGTAEVSLLASVGVSVSHDPDSDPESMLREADVAMYRAKGAGGSRLELFDEKLRREVSAHMEIEGRLRHALPRDELVLAYQPILPLAGGYAMGCEALVRWNPRGADLVRTGQLLPSTFLARAAESPLIVEIGDWVLHNACAQAAIWHRNGTQVPVFVNISARELTELDLAERVQKELRASHLPARSLCLEVSEEAVQRDPERARAALNAVKKLGVVIALDNFGAGQSSLSLPRNLPLDILKLDRALIQGFEHDRNRRAMVAGMIALAHEAGLTAVAVGIETARQLAVARELECAVGQGNLLHPPEPPERLRFRETTGAVTSLPWRPLVRVRGS